MPNRAYIKGVRKERKIVNAAREKGLIAFRSAGSHSPVDVCVIDVEKRRVRFIQAKSDFMCESEKARLEKRYEKIKGKFRVDFKVI